ncbi:hypothetical protein Aperf_G00000017468 [Anoplocephala perfoliata]
MSDSGQRKVEKVVGMRILNGIREYLIKWKGLNESRNTWESEASCNCQDEIRTFLASISSVAVQDQPSRTSSGTGASRSREVESSPRDPTKKGRTSRNLPEKQTPSPKSQAGPSVSKREEEQEEKAHTPEVKKPKGSRSSLIIKEPEIHRKRRRSLLEPRTDENAQESSDVGVAEFRSPEPKRPKMARTPTSKKKTKMESKQLSSSLERQAESELDDTAKELPIVEEPTKSKETTAISTPVKTMKIVPKHQSPSLEHQADTTVGESSKDEAKLQSSVTKRIKEKSPKEMPLVKEVVLSEEIGISKQQEEKFKGSRESKGTRRVTFEFEQHRSSLPHQSSSSLDDSAEDSSNSEEKALPLAKSKGTRGSSKDTERAEIRVEEQHPSLESEVESQEEFDVDLDASDKEKRIRSSESLKEARRAAPKAGPSKDDKDTARGEELEAPKMPKSRSPRVSVVPKQTKVEAERQRPSTETQESPSREKIIEGSFKKPREQTARKRVTFQSTKELPIVEEPTKSKETTAISTPVKTMKIVPKHQSPSLEHQADTTVGESSKDEAKLQSSVTKRIKEKSPKEMPLVKEVVLSEEIGISKQQEEKFKGSRESKGTRRVTFEFEQHRSSLPHQSSSSLDDSAEDSSNSEEKALPLAKSKGTRGSSKDTERAEIRVEEQHPSLESEVESQEEFDVDLDASDKEKRIRSSESLKEARRAAPKAGPSKDDKDTARGEELEAPKMPKSRSPRVSVVPKQTKVEAERQRPSTETQESPSREKIIEGSFKKPREQTARKRVTFQSTKSQKSSSTDVETEKISSPEPKSRRTTRESASSSKSSGDVIRPRDDEEAHSPELTKGIKLVATKKVAFRTETQPPPPESISETSESDDGVAKVSYNVAGETSRSTEKRRKNVKQALISQSDPEEMSTVVPSEDKDKPSSSEMRKFKSLRISVTHKRTRFEAERQCPSTETQESPSGDEIMEGSSENVEVDNPKAKKSEKSRDSAATRWKKIQSKASSYSSTEHQPRAVEGEEAIEAIYVDSIYNFSVQIVDAI